MSDVFSNDDLRSYILEMRKEIMKKEYIKKIYIPWKISGDLTHVFIYGRVGTCSEPNTIKVKWSIYEDNSPIDKACLVMTDFVYDTKKGTIVQHDGTLNYAHIIIREQPWYIHTSERNRMLANGNYDALFHYNEQLENYIHICNQYRDILMNKEFHRRNKILKRNVYFVDEYFVDESNESDESNE